MQVDYSLALANRSAVLQKLNHLEKSIQDIQVRTWPYIHGTSSGRLSEGNETRDCRSRLTEYRMVLREPTLMAPHTATAIPFIYSFSGNCAASAPNSTFLCLWAIYIFPGSVHIFPPAEKADPSWEYINRSQTHINRVALTHKHIQFHGIVSTEIERKLSGLQSVFLRDQHSGQSHINKVNIIFSPTPAPPPLKTETHSHSWQG